MSEIQTLLVYQKKNRGSVTSIADRLGNPEPIENDWLKLTPKDKMPQPEKMAFPKPPKAADGSLIYERVPNKGEEGKPVPMVVSAPAPQAAKRRHPEDVNGVDNSESGASAARSRSFSVIEAIFSSFEGNVTAGPPAKRPNKDPMPSHRPTPEQYAAMISAAAAAGQPLPKHHVSSRLSPIQTAY